jgi:hypothetical protein
MKPLLISLGCLTALLAQDAKPEPRKDLTTNLCLRGKQLFADDFSGAELPAGWKVAKGKWEIVDGALRGAELPDDKHAAVIKRALPFRNLVVQFSFKFEGGKRIALSMDGKGHVCRVTLTPQGFALQRDVAKDSGEKATILGKGTIDFKAGEWHTMLVEVQGKELLAQVDDKVFAFGEHAGIDVDKASIGLPLGGESVLFDDIRVWEAQPNPEWAANKEKLSGKP